MPTVSSSIEIAAPAGSVWDLVSDPRRYPEWVVVTDRMIEVPSDGLRQGATYREYAGLAPFKAESAWLVTVFEPPRHQVHLGADGTVEVELTIEIEPIDGGSRLTQTLDVRPRGMLGALMGVMWPLVMERRLQRANDQTVANVKRLVESGSL
jgi:carbon monoxide dehydrogenase subunit G